jgi:hypothetical protein
MYLGYDKPAFQDFDTARREQTITGLANAAGATKKSLE